MVSFCLTDQISGSKNLPRMTVVQNNDVTYCISLHVRRWAELVQPTELVLFTRFFVTCAPEVRLLISWSHWLSPPTDWFAPELIAALALSLFTKTDKFAGSINTSCHSFLFPFTFPAKYVLSLAIVICYVATFLISMSSLL